MGNLLYNIDEPSPFWSYSHKNFLKSRKVAMRKAENHLKIAAEQMFNTIKMINGIPCQKPG